MRRLIPALLLASAVAACGDRVEVIGNTPVPTPDASYTPEPGRGGPCGDGTVLQPGQHCP